MYRRLRFGMLTVLSNIRSTLVEDDLWWKTTFGGRQPSVEDDLWWKTTFSGGQPLMEDNLRWKTTLCGRRPLVEDNLWWKTTFGGIGWAVSHLDFLIDTKNIEKFLDSKLYELNFFTACCLVRFKAFLYKPFLRPTFVEPHCFPFPF